MTLIWNQFLSIIEQEIGSRIVETWFKAISFYKWDENTSTIYLEAPNAFVKDWVQNHYMDLLYLHLARLLHTQITKIILIIKGNAITPSVVENKLITVPPAKNSSSSSVIIPATKIHGHINPKYVFDSFIVGPNNSLAYAAAQAITQKPGLIYNPLFVYGDSGLGKTHLLHAIGNAVKELHRKAVVLYQTADRFVTEFINAIRFDKVHTFQAKYQNVDVLLIDDIQFISNKEQTQEAFFHIFNTLHNAHKQLVFSSDTFPQNITGIAERLRSRLGWGLVTDMYAPSLETKIAILKKKAEEYQQPIPDIVMHMIASSSISNVRQLEGALIRIVAFALLSKQSITLELAEKVLSNYDNPMDSRKNIDFKTIVKTVRNFYPYELEELCSKNRSKDLAMARHLVMFLMKKHTEKSLRDIGSFLGNRDHATVKHAIEKVENILSLDKALQHSIQNIEKQLYSKC